MYIIKNRIRKRQNDRKWRELNSNNGTTYENEFDMKTVSVGSYTYGPLTVLNFGIGQNLKIGSFCSIASGVVFSVCGDHYINHLSTFPFKAKALGGPLTEAISKGDIVVDDDVWIGQNAVILSGVHIGQGAVVGAGAVVVDDIQPYTVVGGVPAKPIKCRFEKSVVEFLLTLDYSQLNRELIESHLQELYTDVSDMELREIQRLYDWFPKKQEKETNNE